MLNEVVYWTGIAVTAFDGLLLIRVLTLRLHRMYAFITLGCVLSLFFDVVSLWLGPESEANLRVLIYSRFLYALLYPAIAWDVFEEIKGQAGKLRRMHIGRLLSGIILAIFLGLLVAINTQDVNGRPPVLDILAFSLWAGSTAASLSFLWFMRRGIRTEKIGVPNNTFVWMTFYSFILLEELLVCFFSLGAPLVTHTAGQITNLIFDIYNLAVTAWCILKLKPLPSDASAPEKASL
jgi:hypothetical protein